MTEVLCTPASIVCSKCGYLLCPEQMHPRDRFVIVTCTNSSCEMHDKRLKFPLTSVECEELQ